MKDMNVAKLTSTDLPLFNGIMSDLFPGVETPTIDYSEVLIYRIIRVYGLLMIIKYIEWEVSNFNKFFSDIIWLGLHVLGPYTG